ncbi:MAG: glutamine--fructose-6-phosphate transaminase (isomerizing) [Acutalibacteraceae bacterium]|nr:glutamine--fructose-6-phosphate transaminase (isomerizing) [Acutalibacteraceae bacterium]
MCGIVGFVGDHPAAPVLLEGLARLEYRGYDSAGIAIIENKKIILKKSEGELATLTNLIDKGEKYNSTIGIGHTRWATHGKPSDENAHPHLSENGKFAIVHNGIIENYATLKEQLTKDGYTFKSETDSEVVAALLQKYYNGDTFETIVKILSIIEGSYALGILNTDYPDEFYAVRKASPLIVGLSEGGNMIASDIPAVLPITRKIYYLNDNEIVKLTRNCVEIFDTDKNKINREVTEIEWDVSAAEKGGYDHFMIKEIMEQPKAIRDTIEPRIKDGEIILEGFELSKDFLENLDSIHIVACGSAYHVGVVGKYIIEELVRKPVFCEIASEFRYSNPIISEKSLVIIISQSGETADTLEALKIAKRKGAKILSIVNVVGSSIANISDNVLYTWAGPEISVATTKAYSTQLSLMYLVALYMAQKIGAVTDEFVSEMLAEIETIPEKIEEILKLAPKIKEMAKRYAYLDHAYFIGRNFDYAIALEASLKLKEISYIHSEAYAAGELKHGTISLIEEGTFVVGLACNKDLFPKTMSNIKEVKARGAEVMLITNESMDVSTAEVDSVIRIPDSKKLIVPSLEVVPMQLLGYYIALARNCNIDKPKNLAKSVTVE